MKVRLPTIVGLVLALIFGIAPQVASAQAYPGITVTGTAGQGVNLRAEPTTASPIVGKLAEGAKPDILCYKRGQDIGGTDLWFKVASGGYYTSFYDTVPFANQGNLEGIYGIHACDKTLVLDQNTQTQLQQWDVTRPGYYDRQAATSFALANAQEEQPTYFPSCTWFASRVLWAGGLPETEAWHRDGFHGKRFMPGTPVATAAPELVKYLEDHNLATAVDMSFEKNSVPEALVGDLVAYDWDGDDSIDHLAVIVSIAPGQYPEVAEWGTTHPPDFTSNYAKRGWTWSANGNKWLQEVYGKAIKAKLVHIT